MIKVVNLPSMDESLAYVTAFCKEYAISGATIIVPDKLSLFMEKHIFESLNLQASFSLKVCTLDRFVKKNYPVDKSKQISKIGSIVLIHKILMDNFQNLKVLKNKNYSFSYAEEIYNTIAQLKSSKINFEEMFKFQNTNSQLRDKILDLALIYQQYEQNKAGLLDASDQFLLCCLNLDKTYKNENLLFVGFDDFTAVEYTAIECLAYHNKVNIINYFAKSNNQHLYNDEVASQLKNIAYTCSLPFEAETKTLQTDNLKLFLQNNLFGIKPAQFEEENRVNVNACKDVLDELDFVARDIRKKVLLGANYSQFGVAVFGIENYVEIAKQIFKKYDINFYLDTNLNLSETALFRFVCDIFRYNIEPQELSHLIDIINSPFFISEQEDKQKLIEKLVLIDFKGRLTHKFDMGEMNQTKDALVEFLFKFDLTSASTSQIKDIFYNAFEELKFEDIIQDLTGKTDLFDKQILLKKSLETIKTIFDEVEKFYPNAAMQQVYDIVFRLGQVTQIANLPLTLDAVKIVDANNFCERFENLYIVNCTTENAPAFKSDCGIIVDSEIAQLSFSHKLAPTINHINKLARLRLYNSCLMFKSNLTISYNHTPSELIKELCIKLFKKSAFGAQSIKPKFNFDDPFVALSRQDYIEKNLLYNTKIGSDFVKQKDLRQINQESRQKLAFTSISASKLENYFRCPFNYFLNNALKIQPRLQNDILPVDTGNILHMALFNYYKANKKVGDLYQFAKNQVFAAVEKDDRLKLKIDSPLLLNLIDEMVRVLNGVDYIDQNCNFKPFKFEFRFDGKTALDLNGTSLTGAIDRVDESEDGLRIIDYKTGRAEASLKELYYGNKLQLFLYACAMENVMKKPVVGEFYMPLHNVYTTDKSSYSIKGFFENTENVVKNLDTRLTPGQKSDIVNVTMSKDNIARKYSDKELQPSEMKSLKDYSKIVSTQAIEEIKSGFVLPSPSQVSSPCNSCPYSHICLKNCNGVAERKAKNISSKSFEGGEA